MLIQHGIVYMEQEEKQVKPAAEDSNAEQHEVVVIVYYSVDTRYIEARTHFAKEQLIGEQLWGVEGRHIVRELCDHGRLLMKTLLDNVKGKVAEERQKQRVQMSEAEEEVDPSTESEAINARVDKVCGHVLIGMAWCWLIRLCTMRQYDLSARSTLVRCVGSPPCCDHASTCRLRCLAVVG